MQEHPNVKKRRFRSVHKTSSNDTIEQRTVRKELRFSPSEIEEINRRFEVVKKSRGGKYTLSEFIRDCALETKINAPIISFTPEESKLLGYLHKMGVSLFYLWQNLQKAAEKSNDNLVKEVAKKVDTTIDRFDELTRELANFVSGK